MWAVVILVLLLIFCLSLPLLYERFPGFRFYGKFVLYYLGLTGAGLFSVPFIIWRPFRVQNIAVPGVMLTWVSYYLLGLRFTFQDEDSFERLARCSKRSCVIMCNHQSSVDILAIFAFLPIMGKVTAVTKKELKYAGPFGFTAALSGATFVDRGRGRDAVEHLNRAAIKCKEDNVNLFIYPEGTRHLRSGRDRTLLPFKKGGFYAAVAAQMPILPMVIPHYHFMDQDKLRFDPAVIPVKVLEPISTEGLKRDDVESLMAKTRDLMQEAFQKT